MPKMINNLPSVDFVTVNNAAYNFKSIKNMTAIFFTSVYCVRCIDLLPHINKIKKKHHLDIVLFSTGEHDDHEEMIDYFNWDFPVISLDQNEMIELFNLKGTPFCFLVNENGILRSEFIYDENDFDFFIKNEGVG